MEVCDDIFPSACTYSLGLNPTGLEELADVVRKCSWVALVLFGIFRENISMTVLNRDFRQEIEKIGQDWNSYPFVFRSHSPFNLVRSQTDDSTVHVNAFPSAHCSIMKSKGSFQGQTDQQLHRFIGCITELPNLLGG